MRSRNAQISRIIEQRENILVTLAERGGLRTNELSRHVGLSDEQTYVHLVKLSRDGLVYSRGRYWYLTPEGHDYAQEKIDLRRDTDRLLVDEGFLGR